MGQVYGYARVSTNGQDHTLQIDALRAAGVPEGNIVTETVSGVAGKKPRLAALLDKLTAGDTLCMWKVDRIGRSVIDALTVIQRLDEAGVRIVITTLGCDLQSPAGRLVYGVLCQIAAFEREQLIERTNAGLCAAKARGVQLGRRHTLTAHQRQQAAKMVLEDGKSLGEVAALFRVGRTIVHRAVTERRVAEART